MLFYVCKYKFHPVLFRVSIKDNDIADFLSRVYDEHSIDKMFHKKGLFYMNNVLVNDDMFNFVADW